MDLKHFKTDPTLVSEGVWHSMMDGSVEFLLARFGNPECSAAFVKMQSRYNEVALKMMPAKKQQEIYARIVADTVLLDWRETVDGTVRAHTVTIESKQVEFSTEAARELLGDPNYAELLKTVQALSEQLEAYREQATEEAEGNSPAA